MPKKEYYDKVKDFIKKEGKTYLNTIARETGFNKCIIVMVLDSLREHEEIREEWVHVEATRPTETVWIKQIIWNVPDPTTHGNKAEE